MNLKYITGVVMLTIAQSLMGQTTKQAWGATSAGTPVELYTMQNKEASVSITTFGARVVSLKTHDRTGKMGDVVLGYDAVADYEADKSTYFGAIVGRYGNRIAKGTFVVGGETFHVPLNNNANALHGGTVGFDHKVWTAVPIADGVEMTLVSPDGEMGFPGELTAHVRYTLKGSALHIDYTATTTRPTPVNLTNHSYFNLSGNPAGTILDEDLMLDADRYTPVDAGLIPTGSLDPVAGTPFDFRKSTAIGARIHQDNEQLKLAGGYDHNFVLNTASSKGLHTAAKVYDRVSGRTLVVTTTEPGIQFYSGNFLDGTKHGKGGIAYARYAGLCLETQHFPDSPNEPSFPSTILKPGETLHSSTVFTFGIQK